MLDSSLVLGGGQLSSQDLVSQIIFALRPQISSAVQSAVQVKN